ncbi:hypothetical protein EBR21_10890 [bacterium]|nr:hypothetical protein [bacterium]
MEIPVLPKKNALGLIFKVDKQVGRGDVIDIISDFQNGVMVKKQYQHEFCDGLGALLLTASEWPSLGLSLPSRRVRVTNPLTQLLPGIRGFLQDLSQHETKWRHFDPLEKYHPDFSARRVFSHQSSQRILQAAKRQNISLTAFMLWHLNSVISENLMLPEQKKSHWVLPINMRRQKGEELRIENRISSVGLHFDKDLGAEELGALYSATLNPVHAFANEILTEILAMLGERRLLELARSRGKANSWTGIFTNLGQWDFPDSPQLDHWPLAVSITPPGGTPVLPIGAGIMSWRGHLSLSLRLHPALAAKQPELPDRLLDAARRSIENSVGDKTTLLHG